MRGLGGRVILRVEDLDATRSRAEAVPALVEDLRWLGLDWDEGPDVGGPRGPYFQSRRMELYRAALGRLIELEAVYPCTCTRSQIERAASAPHAEDEPPRYPGTCAGRSAGDAIELEARGVMYGWRMRTHGAEIAWEDGVLGKQGISLAEHGGDFLVARSGGVYGYQLAVVVDDALMGVTDVLRGADLVASTPRQLLLYEALGWRAARHAHLPLVVDAGGRRLAKRDGSIQLAALREKGMDARAFVQELARSLGIVEVGAGEGPADWVGRFALGAIPRAAWPWGAGAR
jgi:glutamyl-tRNA synthetase